MLAFREQRKRKRRKSSGTAINYLANAARNGVRRALFEPLEERRLLTVSYTLTDLGTLPGGSYSSATSINNNGQVVGGSTTTSGQEHAFLYSNGTMYDLGVLPGGTSSSATGINDSGQITGNSNTASGLEHGFIDTAGVMIDLGTLIGARESYANGINNSGQVVGEASFSNNQFPAILFDHGQVKNLGTLAGPWSSATAINDLGVIAGGTDTDRNINAFIYQNGVMTDIGMLPNGSYSNATAINNNGQVVGAADIHTGVLFGFLYSNGVMHNLGTLPGGLSSLAQGINDEGDVVGYATLGNGAEHAFLYQNGTMIDLNSLIDPALGWDLEGAADINNAGQIVGFGATPNGDLHAYVLTPLATSHPPQVTGVYVSGTSWVSTFQSGMQAVGLGNGTGYLVPGGGTDQLSDLPWVNLNRIQIQFNENVHVQESSLTVIGISGKIYPFSDFSYDSATDTATWTLSQSIGRDQISLHLQSTGTNAVTDTGGAALDGEWTNGVSAYPSGNGLAGGDFNFTFNVLPGDIAQVNIVNVQSIAVITAGWLRTGYQSGDINGDGIVNSQDLAVVAANWLLTPSTGSLVSATQQSTATAAVATVATAGLSAVAVSTPAASAVVAAEVAAEDNAPLSLPASQSRTSASVAAAGSLATATSMANARSNSAGVLVPGTPQPGNAIVATTGTSKQFINFAAAIDQYMSAYGQSDNGLAADLVDLLPSRSFAVTKPPFSSRVLRMR